jgi:glucuronokinase
MYNGIVYMDFERSMLEATGHGKYERLFPSSDNAIDPSSLGLYIAYDPHRAEESGKAHKKVKKLFEENNCDIISAMSEFADIARLGRDALLKGDKDELSRLLNANFDLRDKVFNVSEENRRMVTRARAVGASAKFAGSGGAIVGLCEDGAMFNRLVSNLAEIGCSVLRPKIAVASDEAAEIKATGWRKS